MTEQEIYEFIEVMEEIGDPWDVEAVERVYGDCSLTEAIQDRRANLDIFFGIIGQVINM